MVTLTAIPVPEMEQDVCPPTSIQLQLLSSNKTSHNDPPPAMSTITTL